MVDAPYPVFYLGDSHVRYIKKAAKFGLLSPHYVSGVEVGGATAVGMRNPNSQTDAIGRFRRKAGDQSRDAILVFHLGEVDCGYVIWYRAEKYHESIEHQMMNSIDAYFEFVDELLSKDFGRIIITGATLPTITDDDQVGEVVIKRSSITATQEQRTALTVRYNELLRDGACRRGLPYIDVDEHVVDPDTGLVDTRMRHPNPENHHMNGNYASVYWAHELREAISLYQPWQPAQHRWTCTRDTYLKAYPDHSKNLPEEMKKKITAGQEVQADLTRVKGKYTILKDVEVEGETYPLLNLLYTDHFESVG